MDIFGLKALTQELKAFRELLKGDNAALREQLKDLGLMLMAGDYFVYKRLKEGKKPLPNKVPDNHNHVELTEDNRIPWDDIKHVSVDGGPKRDVKLYKKL